jgi:iron complex transport system substrate-binding protein
MSFVLKWLLPVAVSASFLMTGCRNPVKLTGKNNSIKVTDFRGVEVVLEKPATSIVCLIESALSGLYMLHAESKVIGISANIYSESVYGQYAALDERIKYKKIPSPGNWDFVNLESVVALQPDLVIIWSSQKESIEAIEERGIAVYGVFLQSLDDVYKEIADLGQLTGRQTRADSLLAYTQHEIARLKTLTRPLSNDRSVYFIWPQGLLETSGTSSTVNELIELAGAKNVCRSTHEHLVVNMESVLEWNPDVIIMWYNAARLPSDIMNIPEWRNVSAVKNKQIYQLPSVFLCDLWTLKFQYAAKLLAKWCYPDSFKGFDIDKEKNDMLLNLYGQKGLKLSE